MQCDLMITGRVVTVDKVYDRASIAVKDGKIVGIGNKEELPNAKEEVDYKDLLILPGAVDAHVHSLGDKYEGHFNSTSAGASGGVTTINDHPLDLGGAPTSEEDIYDKVKRTGSESILDFSLLAEAIPEKMDDIVGVGSVGITGYKTLMHATSGAATYGVRAATNGEMYAMLDLISKTNQPVFVHAEDESIVNYLVDKYVQAGKTSFSAHYETRPEFTETVSVATAIEIARATGCRLHLVHLSVPRSFELVSRARKDGVKVTAETCTHYLICNEERWKDIGAQFKINPPLRSEESRKELWQLLKEGKIHLISSDHAPHPANYEENIFDNFSGSPGIEMTLPMMYSEGVSKDNITLCDLVKLLSYNPSKLLGIYPIKGNIEVGADADFAILDPKEKWVVNKDSIQTRSGWSMYEGMEVQGRVKETYVRGTKVYSEGRILVDKGYGQWVKKISNYNI